MMEHDFTAAPPNKVGYFSPQTSAVNFCEIDYAVTPYIAEFINTLSNFSYIYLSVNGLAPGSSRLNIFSWPAANLTLLFVGIGSFVFHATLKHEAQIVDELSMYAIITSLNYNAYTHPSNTSRLIKSLIALGLVLPFSILAYHNITSAHGANAIAHLVLYTGSVHMFWPRVLYLIYADSHSLQELVPGKPSSNAYRDAVRGDRLSRFYLGGFFFLLGFTLWFLEGLYCHQLRAVRAAIGLPFAWLLELHGSWHIFTAMGAAKFIELVTEFRLDVGQK